MIDSLLKTQDDISHIIQEQSKLSAFQLVDISGGPRGEDHLFAGFEFDDAWVEIVNNVGQLSVQKRLEPQFFSFDFTAQVIWRLLYAPDISHEMPEPDLLQSRRIRKHKREARIIGKTFVYDLTSSPP